MKKIKKIALYYPSNYEVDTFHLFEILKKGIYLHRSQNLPKKNNEICKMEFSIH